MMSSAKKNTRKVAPKKIKDNVNSALKTVIKPEDDFTKVDSSIRCGNPVPPPVAKKLLSNFYDLVLDKLDSNEPLPQPEEIGPDITEARFAKPRLKSFYRRKLGSSGDLPLPCTSDICSKVRQIVQMNNKVQVFKRKFFELPPDTIDEKRAIQQKKLQIGNEYSRRNTSKKVASKVDKTKKPGDEDGGGCESIKRVRWNPEKLSSSSGNDERVIINCEIGSENECLSHSHSNFIDCADDDRSSSPPDSFCDSFRGTTDYTSCADTDCANTSRNSSKTHVHHSSSARMLIHFRELLNMHILPKTADKIKCSILCDEDIAFLKTLVEADEKYHCLKQEDHNLLKDVLKSQLKQIETQERILAETLKKLRNKVGSVEDISVEMTIPNKEKAEQPLEMSEKKEHPLETSEKKEPPYETMLRNFLAIPYGSQNPCDLAEIRSIILSASSSSTENPSHYTTARLSSQNEFLERFILKDLEDNSLHLSSTSRSSPKNESVEPIVLKGLEDNSFSLMSPVQLRSDKTLVTEDDLKYSGVAVLTPLVSHRSGPSDQDIKSNESATTPCEEPKLVVPYLDLDELDDVSLHEILKNSLNWLSVRKTGAGAEKRSSPQKEAEPLKKTELLKEVKPFKSVSARLEKGSKTDIVDEKLKGSVSERKESKDIIHIAALIGSKKFLIKSSVEDQNIEDLNSPTLDDVDDHSENLKDPAILFGATTPPGIIFSRIKVQRPTKDQETNTSVLSVRSGEGLDKSPNQSSLTDRKQNTNTLRYLNISFEYMLFVEELATVEVWPLFLSKCKHIAKEFRMKYLPIDELNNAGEFFILNSELSDIKIEKTNFEELHKQPEKLTKLLQPMYKQPVDKAVSTSDDATNYKFLYPWQITDYPVPEDIMIQNVICCLFKTWATYPELYKQTIANCKSIVPSQLLPPTIENIEFKDDDSTVKENKQEIEEQIPNVCSADTTQQEIASNELRNVKYIKKPRRTFKKKITPKNLLVLSAQFLLFTVLVLGLSLFQYKCLDM